MLTEEEQDKLTGIFYREAPHDYVLTFEPKKRKDYHGMCVYEEKACILFGPDDYYKALETLLHEVAHANVQHRTHSDVWEKELVRLLTKYKFPRNLAGRDTIIGPNVREYIDG